MPTTSSNQYKIKPRLPFIPWEEKKSKLSSIYTYLLKLEANRTQGPKLAPIRRIRRSSTILQLNFSECRVLLYVSLPTLVTSACGFALSPSDYAPVLLKKHIYVICTYSLQMMCSPGNGQNITALTAREPETTKKKHGISGHVGLFPSWARTWKNQWSNGRKRE